MKVKHWLSQLLLSTDFKIPWCMTELWTKQDFLTADFLPLHVTMAFELKVLVLLITHRLSCYTFVPSYFKISWCLTMLLAGQDFLTSKCDFELGARGLVLAQNKPILESWARDYFLTVHLWPLSVTDLGARGQGT
jgi:hypothetical protein